MVFKPAQQSTRSMLTDKTLAPLSIVASVVATAIVVTLWLSGVKEQVRVHDTRIDNNCDQIKRIENRFDSFDMKLDKIISELRKP